MKRDRAERNLKAGPAVAKALIYAEDGSHIVDQCLGPSWAGGCPRSLPGRPVACAGRKIALVGRSGMVRLVLTVEPLTACCPLAALNLVGRDFAEHAAAQTKPGAHAPPGVSRQ